MIKKRQDMKKLKKLFIILLSLCVLLAVIILSLNFYIKSCTNDRILTLEEAGELQDVDCILVLGCGVYEDGSLSPMLRDRLDTATDVYELGVTPKLLMSGDHGKVDYNEVRAMKDYVVNNGTAVTSDVFMDHAGFSTYESLYRAKDIFQADKIIIVTNTYHLYRSLYIAKSLVFTHMASE